MPLAQSNQRRGRQRLGDGHLVHAGRRRHRRGQQHVRRQPDADGDRQAARPALAPGGLRPAALDQAGGDAGPVQPQQPVVAAFGPVSGSLIKATAAVA